MTIQTQMNELVKLTPDLVKKAIITAGDAFRDDPVMVYTYPDDVMRKEKSPYGFYMLYNYASKKGYAYATSSNLEGITIWLPPGKTEISFWTMMRYGMFYTMRKVGLKMKAMKKTMKIFNYEDERHKALAPFKHWYFLNIAVKPEEWNKGYGSHLIRSMLKKVVGDGLPIYVETNTEKAASLYQKHGFEILERTTIPETPVELWCMLRQPE